MRLIAKIFAVLILLIGGSYYYNSGKPEPYPDNSLYEATVSGYRDEDVYRFVFPKAYLFFPAHHLENKPLMLQIRIRPNEILAEKNIRWEEEASSAPSVDRFEDMLESYAEVHVSVGGQYVTHKMQQSVFPDALRGQQELEAKFGLLFLGLVPHNREYPKGQLIGRYWAETLQYINPIYEYFVDQNNSAPKGFYIYCIRREIRPNGMCAIHKDVLKNLRMKIIFHSKSLPRWREFDQRITEFVLSHIKPSAETE